MNITKIVMVLLLMLSGCISLKYDPVEYNYAIISSVASTRARDQCDATEDVMFKRYINDLNDATMHLQEYEKFSKNKNQIYEDSVLLRQLVSEFVLNEDYSKKYCYHKLSGIVTASNIMAINSGKQKETRICFYDSIELFASYKESYISGDITIDELESLVNGLKNISKMNCNNNHNNEIYAIKNLKR